MKRTLGFIFFLAFFTLGWALDYSSAKASLLQKASVAGDRRAQFYLAMRYAAGEQGVPHDLKLAFSWLEKSGNLGDAEAQFYLGQWYGSGVYPGGEDGVGDFSKAAEWYKKSAEQNYQQSQGSLSRLYFSGKGVPKDMAEGWKWEVIAMPKEDRKARVDSAFSTLLPWGVFVWGNRGLWLWDYWEGNRRAEEWLSKHVAL